MLGAAHLLADMVPLSVVATHLLATGGVPQMVGAAYGVVPQLAVVAHLLIGVVPQLMGVVHLLLCTAHLLASLLMGVAYLLVDTVLLLAGEPNLLLLMHLGAR